MHSFPTRTGDKPSLRALALLTALLGAGCASAGTAVFPQRAIIPHSQWEATPRLGHTGDGTRRNIPPGEALHWKELTVAVLAIGAGLGTPAPDTVRLRLRHGAAAEERTALEGEAFNWEGYHIAVVAVPGKGELGAGLVALEVASVASIPAEVAASRTAGGAAMRLRVAHEITHVTLHHIGSAEPLRPEDDPAAKLRGLQAWGASDRNWWDVPYHLLVDLEGDVYEGRDWHFMGETNTTYDPAGHLLISIIGNYERQEPTPAQLEAIADLMAWGVSRFGVPLDRIGGHYNYAETGCPGKHLKKYLEDGTFRRMVEQRLSRMR